ncbi:hypothetical protein KKI19_01150 [Patescibacteria group bacterium]|nr:hypothetical protein [Patescibacteria group bacterium]
MPTSDELSPEQRGILSNEALPWENLPRIDFSLEEAETCLFAFETCREIVDEEIRTVAWEKINFFLLKAQAQNILGFSYRFNQKKTAALALKHLPLEEQDSLGNFRYPQFRTIVDWARSQGRIEESAWDNYRRKGKFTNVEIGKIFDVCRERARQWVTLGMRALRHPSRAQKLYDHCLEIARPEEWEKITREREEIKIRDIWSLQEVLSTRSLHALLRKGISTIPQVLSLSDKELQAIKGIGPVGKREIREALEQYLESLSPETRSTLESEALDLPKAEISRREKIIFPKTRGSSGV